LYARVRGIYSTAITKLLLEKGIKVTQPTKPIIKRFKLHSPIYCPPDVTVKDLSDKQGVLVIGAPKAVKEVVCILIDKLQQVIVKEYKPSLYSLYKGIVKEVRPDGSVLVDIGVMLGVLQEGMIRPGIGDELLVCVRKPSFNDFPKLSTQLVVSGKYMRLIKGAERVMISEFIRDPLKKEELLSLGFMIKPKGWGIRWRSSANYATTEELLKEVEELKNRVKELETKAKEVKTPSLIEEGEAIAEVLFTLDAKRILDEVRRHVVPTIDYHHYLKSVEGFSERVDFTEYLLAKGLDMKILSRALLEYHIKTMMRESVRGVTLYHLTIKGDLVRMRGVIHDVFDDGVLMVRKFSPSGYYDGIGEKKERGDYGFTLIRLFKPYIIHFYYSKSDVLKGIYFNINTPVELVSVNTFRYIDLEVDVVKSSRGVKVLDYDVLEDYVKRGVLPKEYVKDILNLIERVKSVLMRDEFKTPLELEEELLRVWHK